MNINKLNKLLILSAVNVIYCQQELCEHGRFTHLTDMLLSPSLFAISSC